MNFEQLEQAGPEYDEIMPIGRDVEKEGKRYHITGMTRRGSEACLYVIEPQEPVIEERMRKSDRYLNRDSMKITEMPGSYFSNVSAVCIGNRMLEGRSSVSGSMALETGYDCESALLFANMMRAGWQLPPESGFRVMDWQNIWLTKLVFHTQTDSLPEWNGQEVTVRLRFGGRSHYIEKPVTLTVGEEKEIAFSYDGGENAVCYLNRVFVMDVWEEYEKMFQKMMQDPELAQKMTKKQIENHREEFYRNLGENCPKGTCYPVVEYECTAEGSLAFYSREFLDAAAGAQTGSARIMMMHHRPEESVGKHGLCQQGCVIQTPVSPDARQIEAELFRFTEKRFEREELL